MPQTWDKCWSKYYRRKNTVHRPFVKARGLDAILGLFLIPNAFGNVVLVTRQLFELSFGMHAHPFDYEDQLSMAFKCIALCYNSGNLMEKMAAALEVHLVTLERIQRELLEAFAYGTVKGEQDFTAEGILENLPRVPLHDAIESADFCSKARHLSEYLRAVVTLQQLSNLFAGVIQADCQRSQKSQELHGFGVSFNRKKNYLRHRLFRM
jgi:hypothetical protein|mmetsp:Transcript_12778/g.23162  ORF Transcript_12778/g.23162 Transcript_12778/m.23162 type:complete len:209 (+) Transcript_12778:1987-2613(+)